MTRAARTLPSPFLSLCWALLLTAAGSSALAQPPEAASAPEARPASDAPAQPAPLPTPPLPAPPLKASPLALPPMSALAPAPNWQSLTPAQQALLAPLASDWDKLGPSQRSKWLNAAPRLASLPAPELARLHERMRDWAHLTPGERADARVGFQVAKQVDAEERQAKWEAYQALPPEKRQALVDKAAARRQAQSKAADPVPKPLVAAPKSNIVPSAPKLMVAVPVTGGLIQAKPGATTVLITRGLAQPSHHAAGESKVVADPALVDPKTLLPKSLKAPAAPAKRP